jgi:uncharacterized protein (TIGR03083 family)
VPSQASVADRLDRADPAAWLAAPGTRTWLILALVGAALLARPGPLAPSTTTHHDITNWGSSAPRSTTTASRVGIDENYRPFFAGPRELGADFNAIKIARTLGTAHHERHPQAGMAGLHRRPSPVTSPRPLARPELTGDAVPYHPDVTTAELYHAVRAKMLDLAAGLSREQSELPVPALPGWSVKDAYAHLTGLCADMLDGHMEGAGSAAWTTKQLAARSSQDLPKVCAEWLDRGPALDARLAKLDATFVAFDVWNHHQDVRSAVGLRGERDPGQVDYLAAEALSAFDGRFREAGVPALRVITERIDRNLGAGPPDATLSTTDYELLRILFGRRSLPQMTNAGWTGDPTAYLDHLHLFDPPVSDLDD